MAKIDENWEHIKKFTEEHKGELMLDWFEVVRLEGCRDIPDDDYYYVIREFGFCGKEILCSAVFDPIPLKGFLPNNIYSCLEEVFKKNILEEKNNGKNR